MGRQNTAAAAAYQHVGTTSTRLCEIAGQVVSRVLGLQFGLRSTDGDLLGLQLGLREHEW